MFWDGAKLSCVDQGDEKRLDGEQKKLNWPQQHRGWGKAACRTLVQVIIYNDISSESLCQAWPEICLYRCTSAAVQGIIWESAASWACSTPFSSCIMITMVLLRLMNINECHGDVPCWCCGDSWVIYLAWGGTLSRKLDFREGTPVQQPNNESKRRIELSISLMVKLSVPGTQTQTSPPRHQ